MTSLSLSPADEKDDAEVHVDDDTSRWKQITAKRGLELDGRSSFVLHNAAREPVFWYDAHWVETKEEQRELQSHLQQLPYQDEKGSTATRRHAPRSGSATTTTSTRARTSPSANVHPGCCV